jgi:hypothetical protein
MDNGVPALQRLRTGSIGGSVVIVGQLDATPTSRWHRTFDRVVGLAGFGVHPHLEDDLVIAIAEPAEAGRADYAVRTAIAMTTEATTPPDGGLPPAP